MPDISILSELCKVLRISIEDLFSCNVSKKNSNDIKPFDAEEFSKSLKLLRSQHKLTQQQFAKKINVSFPTVIAWEKAKSTPSLKDFISICKLYSLKASELYYGQIKIDYESKKKKRNTFIVSISGSLLAATLIAIIVPLAIKANVRANDSSTSKEESTTSMSTISSEPISSSSSVEPPAPIVRTITLLSDDKITELYRLTYNDNDHVTSINYVPLKESEGKIYEFKGWDINDDQIPDPIDLYMTQDYALVAVFEEKDEPSGDGLIYTTEAVSANEVYLVSCDNLDDRTEVILPNYANGKKVIGVKTSLFDKSETLKKIIIPEGIRTFESKCFYNLANLEEIYFPSETGSIGSRAFMNDTSLIKVTLPLKLSSLGGYAFSGCASLKEIDVSCLTMLNAQLFNGCKSLETITGLEHVKDISSNFAYGTAIKSLTFTADNMNIFEGAFDGMKELRSLDIQGEIYCLNNNEFKGCDNFEYAILPKDITYWYASKNAIGGECKTIYYRGTEGNFSSINFSGEYKFGLIENKNVYFYSETPATQCWHYVDQIPTKY